jgi:NTE family protein
LQKKQKIGLALGSGSARGWAHIGVIESLTEAGIKIDCIAGTSIGALVGAVFASGKIDKLKEIILQLDWKQILSFFDIVFPKSGLIDGKKVSDFIRKHIQEKSFVELSIPFCAVSTDLSTGQEVIIDEGDVIEAVRASISVPGIFTPVKKDDIILVDGGLVNPVPVNVVRDMGADFVIAVDLNHDIIEKKRSIKRLPSSGGINTSAREASHDIKIKNRILKALNEKLETIDLPALTQIKRWMSRDPMPNIFEVLLGAINIMEVQITTARLKIDPPDLLIQPKLGHIRFLEFNRAQEAIDRGYQETMKKIRDLSER